LASIGRTGLDGIPGQCFPDVEHWWAVGDSDCPSGPSADKAEVSYPPEHRILGALSLALRAFEPPEDS
jgi:hypothetical protein